ncbi:adhesin [Pseudomonas sp. SH1-B]
MLIPIALMACISAHADSINARIDSSGQDYQGNLAINQAAGVLQQQVNSRALSVGGHGMSTTTIVQVQENLPHVTSPLDTQASISGNSFSNGRGIVGVNQAAGIANQQINSTRVVLIAVPESLDDSVLAQSVTRSNDPISTAPMPGGERHVDISNEAFAGSRGVVQVNQSAGIGNRTANQISIRVVD